MCLVGKETVNDMLTSMWLKLVNGVTHRYELYIYFHLQLKPEPIPIYLDSDKQLTYGRTQASNTQRTVINYTQFNLYLLSYTHKWSSRVWPTMKLAERAKKRRSSGVKITTPLSRTRQITVRYNPGSNGLMNIAINKWLSGRLWQTANYSRKQVLLLNLIRLSLDIADI